MSASLSQIVQAGFADRGRVGMRCTMAAGCDGRYVSVDLGATLSHWHTRFMLQPLDAAGGEMVLLHGVDANEGTAFEVRFETDPQTIAVVRDGVIVLSADLAPGLAWHAIEVGVDASTDSITLWLNGIGVDSTPIDPGGLPTRAMRFGVPRKRHNVIGELDLDEWVIADGYIGPVVVEPVGEHAADPRRWAVVYNTASTASVAWAEHYRAARGVPHANLIGLTLPTDELITETQFAAMRDEIDDYLDRNGLSLQIAGLLVGHGVPGRYARSDGYEESIAGQLQKIDSVSAPIANPFAMLTGPSRPAVSDHPGYRLTARVDGPTQADSQALVDRAVAIEQQGLGDGSSATLWLDAVTTGSVYEPLMNDMLAWASSLRRQALRLPLTVTEPTEPPSEVGFASIENDGFFWGWRAASPPQGFFAEPAGLRVFAAQIDDFAITAPTLRDAQSSSWAIASLHAGYAAAMGSSRPVSLSAMPLIRPFFEGIEAGWTLGEAWAVATPLLRSGVELIGDPLLTVRLPRSGWNVYGPCESIERVDFSKPTAMRREDQLEYPLGIDEQPTAEARSVYVVRRVDHRGREATGSTSITVGAATPVWPGCAGWSPRLSDGRVELVWVWARRFGELGIERVELVEQAQGQGPQPVGVYPLSTDAWRFASHRDMPAEATRWRLIVWAADGSNTPTPWSRYVQPTNTAVAALATL